MAGFVFAFLRCLVTIVGILFLLAGLLGFLFELGVLGATVEANNSIQIEAASNRSIRIQNLSFSSLAVLVGGLIIWAALPKKVESVTTHDFSEVFVAGSHSASRENEAPTTSRTQRTYRRQDRTTYMALDGVEPMAKS